MERYTNTILNKQGKPVAGAVVTVTTYPGNEPAVIYAADGGPAVRSVSSDENGRFAFYAADGHYNLSIVGKQIDPITLTDIVLNDPNDELDLAKQIREIVVTPTTFGGNVTLSDNGPAIQAAANSLMMMGGVITIPRGTWKVTTANIALPPNTQVRLEAGAVIDMAGAASNASLFVASGTKGAAYGFSANLTKRSTSASMAPVDLVASAIAVGDWVRIASNALFDPQRTATKIGELIQVDTVNPATGVLTFKTPLCDDYATTDAATITRVVLAQGVRLTGEGKIKGGAAGNNQKAITFTLCYRPFVGDGLQFESANDRAIYFIDCVQPRAHRVSFEDALNAATAYGISVADASCDGVFTQIVSRNVRHLFSTNNTAATGGIPRRHTLSNWSAKQSAYATGGSGGDSVDAHAAAEDIHIWNGESHGSTSCGVNLECRSGSVINVFTYDSASHGVSVHNETARPGHFVLSNVHGIRAGGDGVRVSKGVSATTTGYEFLMMSNVSGTDTSSTGVYVSGPASNKIQNANLSNLSALRFGSTAGGLYVENIVGGSLIGAMASDPGAVGTPLVRVRDCDYFTVSAGRTRHLSASTGAGFYVDASAAGTSKNVVISGCVTAFDAPVNAKGLQVNSNALNVTAGSNDFSQATTPISWGTGTGHKGGNLSGSATYDPVSLADGEGVTTTLAVPGAALGDAAQATFSLSLQGVLLNAWVSAANTVSVRFQNETGAVVDLASGTLRATTFKI